MLLLLCCCFLLRGISPLFSSSVHLRPFPPIGRLSSQFLIMIPFEAPLKAVRPSPFEKQSARGANESRRAVADFPATAQKRRIGLEGGKGREQRPECQRQRRTKRQYFMNDKRGRSLWKQRRRLWTQEFRLVSA